MLVIRFYKNRSGVGLNGFLRGLAAALIVLLLPACGGGGGGGSPATSTSTSTTPTPAPVVTLSSSASDVPQNSAVTLTWSATNASSCTASGAWSGTRSASGSSSVTVAQAQGQTYSLACTGAGGSGSASVAVTGWNAPTVSVSADETDLLAGNTATVTWSATNAVSCTGSGGFTSATGLSGSLTTPLLSTTTTYALSCSNPGFAAVAGQVTINVSATVTLAVTLQYQAPGAPILDTSISRYVPNWANPVSAGVPFVYAELANGSGAMLQSGFADQNGVSTFTGLAPTATVTPRFQSRIQYAPLTLDFEVVDNVTPLNTTSTAIRNRYPVYKTTAAAFTPSGKRAHQAVTVTLPDGWNSTTSRLVDANRVAGPYEVLAVATREAQILSRAIGGNPGWRQLTILWSTANKGGKSAPPDNFDQGFVTGSGGYYSASHGGLDASGATTGSTLFEDFIYLSGDPTFEAMEIYPFIMSHEMGHFIQSQFSHSNSPGGSHAYTDNEDPRLSWGEGSASGIAALVLGTPEERRVVTSGSTIIVSIVDIARNTNNGNPQTWPVGWYQESTIANLMWSLQDPAGSIGLAPETVLAAMLGTTWNNQPWAGTVWAFVSQLKSANPTVSAQIDTWSASHNIDAAGDDVWGSTESHLPQGVAAADVLPPYTLMSVGVPLRICSAGAALNFNKAGNNRLLRLPASSTSRSLVMRSVASAVPYARIGGFGSFSAGQTTLTATGATAPSTETVAAVGDCSVVREEFSATACQEASTPPSEQCWNLTLQ